ncbi:MAG: hypothetical protein HY825_15700 [Acidobacteria bacterium]|nr:hypothetical protein [Acidobacteriota bacterium]
MNTNLVRRFTVAALATCSLALATTTLANAKPVQELRQVGSTAVVSRGADVDVALSYRFAKANPGGKWLLLDVGMTTDGAPVEIARSAISVRTPAGDVVRLATEQAFLDDYGVLAPVIARASVAREPMNYLRPQREARLEYFAPPGRELTYPSVWLDALHNTYGSLLFRIPGGVQNGRYELLIHLPESSVAIPFTI